METLVINTARNLNWAIGSIHLNHVNSNSIEISVTPNMKRDKFITSFGYLLADPVR